MKMFRLLVGAGLLGAAALTQAVVLGHVGFSQTYDLPLIVSPTGATASTAVTVGFAFSQPGGGPTDTATLVFDGFLISNGDDGRRMVLTSAADDGELPAFLAHLTNGVDEELGVNVIGNEGGGSGLIAPESGRLVKLPAFAGPDLAGAVLTGLELFISAITINPDAVTPMQNWSITGELRVLGTAPSPVPLPPAAWGLASALALLTSLRNRRGSR